MARSVTSWSTSETADEVWQENAHDVCATPYFFSWYDFCSGEVNTPPPSGGGVFTALIKTGSAFYAPGAAVVEMVQAILRDEKRTVPCSAYLEGEYGLHDLCFDVPVKIGEGGIEAIMEVELTAEEQAAVQVSAEAVHKSIASLGL